VLGWVYLSGPDAPWTWVHSSQEWVYPAMIPAGGGEWLFRAERSGWFWKFDPTFPLVWNAVVGQWENW